MINCLMLTLFSVLLVPSISASEITIFDGKNQKEVLLQFDPSSIDLQKFEVKDPNFPEKGIRSYHGISLERFVRNKGKLTNIENLSIVAEGDYVCSWNQRDLKKDNPILTVLEDGNPIQRIDGGPLKIMFTTIQPMAAYCWYVKAIIVNLQPKQSLPIFGHSGTKLAEIARRDITSAKVKHENLLLPNVRGFTSETLRREESKQSTIARLTDVLASKKILVKKSINPPYS